MLTAEINKKLFRIEVKDSDFSSGKINNEDFITDIIKHNENSFHVIFHNKSYNINILSIDLLEKTVNLKINNNSFNVKLSDELDLLLNKMGINSKTKKIKKELKAPMPGLVVNIPVKKGDIIKHGETLLVLEAMKMENNLKAEHDVTIKNISAKKGKSVEKNEVLIIFE